MNIPSNQYNQNYTEDEIATILERIKDCIRNDHYSIAQNENRSENTTFINEYNLRVDRQKEILMRIEVRDFCYSSPNNHPGYEYEILYIFAPRVVLINAEGEQETVDVYIKFNMIEDGDKDYTVVISFHKLNWPIRYCFT